MLSNLPSFFKKVVFTFVMLFGVVGYSQCAMCRAALESGGDTKQAEAVNDGIVYLMVIPYILVGVIAFAIYYTRRKSKLG